MSRRVSGGGGEAVSLGLSSLRSEARNSHAPVGTPGRSRFLSRERALWGLIAQQKGVSLARLRARLRARAPGAPDARLRHSLEASEGTPGCVLFYPRSQRLAGPRETRAPAPANQKADADAGHAPLRDARRLAPEAPPSGLVWEKPKGGTEGCRGSS